MNLRTETIPRILRRLKKKNLIEDRPAASRQSSPQTRGTNHFSSRGNEADDLNGFNDFKSILTKWAGFVDEVSSEKGLIFGPLLKRVKPIEMQGNKIMFSSSDEHDKKVVADQQEYINKKTHEYFGKKLNFIVSVIKSDDSPKPGNGTSSPKNEIREPANPNDPYVKAILEELGGQEIY